MVPPPMAHLYDLMLLLDAAAPEERRQEILGDVQGAIEDGGGTIVALHDWGSRRMSFEIDHRPDADYKLLQIEAGNELLERLNASLRIMDGVMRFRVIRQKPGGPEVPPAPDPIRSGRPADEPDGRVAARAAADAAPDAPVDDDE
jgi:small subunit ribosomal protein S6